MASERSPKSRTRGSGRAMTFALVLFILAWTLAPPAQRYFAQKAQINSVLAQVASNNQALADAAKELEKWRDPEYIKTQARERLHFILPGERQYIVTDPTEPTSEAPTTAVAKDIPSGLPWYNRLIASITETGVK
ncbi:MAG: septum formation initiator family protein [Candidatus Nanopelagicaceae bacterium]|nr:septum formation initiator family protein [Candidatus Nanopelagicaceae bacterium]